MSKFTAYSLSRSDKGYGNAPEEETVVVKGGGQHESSHFAVILNMTGARHSRDVDQAS